MIITLNGVDLPAPQRFEREWFPISNYKRLASGKMAGSVIAKKRKFTIGYNTLTDVELSTIADAVTGITDFVTFEFIDLDGSAGSCQVYAGALKAALYMMTEQKTIYTDVNFSFIEQ